MKQQNHFQRKSLIGLGTTSSQQRKSFKTWFMMKVFISTQKKNCYLRKRRLKELCLRKLIIMGNNNNNNNSTRKNQKIIIIRNNISKNLIMLPLKILKWLQQKGEVILVLKNPKLLLQECLNSNMLKREEVPHRMSTSQEAEQGM
jgi:hypothetical protein